MDEFVVFEALKKDEIKHIVRLQVRFQNSSVCGYNRMAFIFPLGCRQCVAHCCIPAICTAPSMQRCTYEPVCSFLHGQRAMAVLYISQIYITEEFVKAFACACSQRAVCLLTMALVRAG